jgi:hypothetical protein
MSVTIEKYPPVGMMHFFMWLMLTKQAVETGESLGPEFKVPITLNTSPKGLSKVMYLWGQYRTVSRKLVTAIEDRYQSEFTEEKYFDYSANVEEVMRMALAGGIDPTMASEYHEKFIAWSKGEMLLVKNVKGLESHINKFKVGKIV